MVGYAIAGSCQARPSEIWDLDRYPLQTLSVAFNDRLTSAQKRIETFELRHEQAATHFVDAVVVTHAHNIVSKGATLVAIDCAAGHAVRTQQSKPGCDSFIMSGNRAPFTTGDILGFVEALRSQDAKGAQELALILGE
jgi:hypothetical protein